MPRRNQFPVILIALVCHVCGLLATDVDPETKNHYRAADLLPFSKATEWTVLSLDPMPWDLGEDPFATPAPSNGKLVEIKEPKKKVPPEQEFHGFPILGQTKVAVTQDLKTVITTLDEAGRHWTKAVAGCFSPRHGIRVVSDGVTFDLVICYECMSADIYRSDKKIGSIYFATDARWLPRPAFLNGALIRAKVKMPPPPHH
jgi:hypothetical protein